LILFLFSFKTPIFCQIQLRKYRIWLRPRTGKNPPRMAENGTSRGESGTKWHLCFACHFRLEEAPSPVHPAPLRGALPVPIAPDRAETAPLRSLFLVR
jgi:hypothetical protein